MCAIANRRRLRGLTLRRIALIALAVTSLAIMGMSASSAFAASSYQVHECSVDNPSAPDAVYSGNVNYPDWATTRSRAGPTAG